jgi:hypothetical protein
VHRQAPTFLSHQFPATGIGATWWARPAQTELRAGRAGARLAALVATRGSWVARRTSVFLAARAERERLPACGRRAPPKVGARGEGARVCLR